MKCAECKSKECYTGKDCTGLKEELEKRYVGEDKQLMEAAAKLEAEHYMKLTRVEELIEFGKTMEYKKLGLAFCIGLQAEAKTLNNILKTHFKVYSVCCKVCGINKNNLGVPHIRADRFEAICNPIGQAEMLNKKKTDLNIACGLCLGHDILFSKHSKAPVTTVIVKDRVLAHNPSGVLHSWHYKKKLGLK